MDAGPPPTTPPLVECVPNFSEGRDAGVIRDITDAIESVPGVRLLDVDPGVDANRTVVTFEGAPDAVADGAVQGAATAARIIDMRVHRGTHPRMGATDVIPFVPLEGIDLDGCANIARGVGRRVGEELGVGVYLYGHAATRPERRSLYRVRSGEYEGMAQKLTDPQWRPDFGPTALNLRAGVTAVGARDLLVAFNVNLDTMDRRYADDIAGSLRERGRWKRTGDVHPLYSAGDVVRFPVDGRYPCGPCDFVGGSFEALETHYRSVHGGDLRARYASLGIDPERPSGPVFTDGRFKGVQAIGWVMEAYGCAQVSMNLTDLQASPPHRVMEAVREEARARGIGVTGSELVGLIPWDAIREAGAYYFRREGRSGDATVAALVDVAAQGLGLRDVKPFDPRRKVLGLPPAEARVSLEGDLPG